MLETRAIEDESYETIRTCVMLAERIRYSARKEGFDRLNEAEEFRVFSPEGLPDFIGKR